MQGRYRLLIGSFDDLETDKWVIKLTSVTIDNNTYYTSNINRNYLSINGKHKY